MSILFENRITEAGRQAIQETIDYVAHELQRAIDVHGESSPETLQCLLACISIEHIMEPDEQAHAGILPYLDLSKVIHGLHSIEVGNGLFPLGWSHAGLEREEEEGLAIQQSLERPGGKRDFLPIEPMLDSLCQILGRLWESPSSEDRRHAFVLAVRILSWLVTYCPVQSPSFHIFLELIRPVLESRGYRNGILEWIMRRCNRLNNHFVGLISVLLEERLSLFEPKECHDSPESDSEEDVIVRGYEISGLKPEHWSSPEGFSKQFTLSVAEGELSMRVERLLAVGCRCLSTTGGLGTVFLVFSDHFIGRRITAFGTTNSLDEERTLFQDKVRGTIAEYGADSAMMLDWVDLHHQQTPEADDITTEAVTVVARDAKSYLRGLQPGRLIDGKYVFDEPMVRVAKDNWFSEFTFPVKLAAKTRRTKEKKKSNRQGKE